MSEEGATAGADIEREASALTEQLDAGADAPLPHTRLSARLDSAIDRVGTLFSRLWAVLLGVIVLNVTLRYAFGAGRIEFEELQWHLYALGFLVGLSYCVPSDGHIRVDFLRHRFTARMRAWIELYGLLLLVFPFVLLVLLFSVPFVSESFTRGEVSPSPGGLPMRWVIKAAIPLAFALLGVASFSRLLRVSCLLFGTPPARDGAGRD
jgi:TRAP-type mannitol/chloroaromatic compound transport system permease small subunit